MRLEWDANKNESNIAKHGIDFHDAVLVFDAPMRIISDTRHDYGEDRLIGLGILGTRVVVVAFTGPEDDVIRVFSMRRALTHERKQYAHYLKQLFG